MSTIHPFQIDIADTEITELHHRLRNTRWPDAETPDDWSQGVPLAYAQEFCSYWANDYDWAMTNAAYKGHESIVRLLESRQQ